jgi:hypothetical protein
MTQRPPAPRSGVYELYWYHASQRRVTEVDERAGAYLAHTR